MSIQFLSNLDVLYWGCENVYSTLISRLHDKINVSAKVYKFKREWLKTNIVMRTSAANKQLNFQASFENSIGKWFSALPALFQALFGIIAWFNLEIRRVPRGLWAYETVFLSHIRAFKWLKIIGFKTMILIKILRIFLATQITCF